MKTRHKLLDKLKHQINLTHILDSCAWRAEINNNRFEWPGHARLPESILCMTLYWSQSVTVRHCLSK